MEIRNNDKTLVTKTNRVFDYDRIWLGAVLGIVAPILTMLAFYYFNFSHISILKFIEHLFAVHIQSSLLSLSVVSNLLVFFVFIWTEKYQSARGVLMSTFLYGGLVVYLKFFA